MIKLFFLFLIFTYTQFAQAETPTTQFGQLMHNAGPRNANELFDAAWNSGAIKPEKKNEAFQPIQNAYAMPQNKNLSPRQMYYEVEKSLSKANVLTFASSIPQDVAKPNQKTTTKIETSSSVTSTYNPNALDSFSPKEAIGKLKGSDSYKIYSAIKPFLSKEGKKDNNRREIIQIINESKVGPAAKPMKPEEIQKLTGALLEKGYLN